MNGKRVQPFWTQAVFNFKTKEGLIQIYFRGQVIALLSTQEAVDFADGLVQASSNTGTDSFLVNFWIEHEGVSDEEIRQRLSGLAEWRSKHEPMMGADRGLVSRTKAKK